MSKLYNNPYSGPLNNIRYALIPVTDEMGQGDSWFTISVCPRSPTDRQECCTIKQTRPASSGRTTSMATDVGHPCNGLILGMNTVQGPSHTVVIEHCSDDNAGINGVNLFLTAVTGTTRAYYSCHGDNRFQTAFMLDEIRELVCRLALTI